MSKRRQRAAVAPPLAEPSPGGYSPAAFRRAVAESAPPVVEDPPVEADEGAEPDNTEAGDAARLRRYWLTGPGAAKIGWGTSGDFTRCVRALDGKMTDPKGYCAELHKTATGMWPGDKRNNADTPTPPTGGTQVNEATVGGAQQAGPGRLLVRLIRAGWSLNGNHYGADVLRRAAEGGVFGKGTLCYVDHATDEEDAARPAGSIRNLAGALVEDARWDENQQALMGEVRLFAPWREAITDMAEHIGMSIRAWVYGDQGEAEGRTGFVVSDLAEGRSVDFVTVPAAGGGIVSVLESVGHRVPVAEARNVGAWLESRLHLALTQLADDMFGNGRLTRPERITLSGAIGDALTVYAARIERDAPQLYQRDIWDEPETPEPQAATEANHDPAPGSGAGKPEQPAPPSADDPPAMPPGDDSTTSNAPGNAPAEHEEEGVMPETTEEVKAREAAEAAERARVEAETKLAEALAAKAESDKRLARHEATETARPIVQSLLAESDLPAAAQARVMAAVTKQVPLTEANVLDETALKTAVEAEIKAEAAYLAQLQEANGVGRVSGMGGAAPVVEAAAGPSEADLKALTEAYVARGMNPDAAKLAARGRRI